MEGLWGKKRRTLWGGSLVSLGHGKRWKVGRRDKCQSYFDMSGVEGSCSLGKSRGTFGDYDF